MKGPLIAVNDLESRLVEKAMTLGMGLRKLDVVLYIRSLNLDLNLFQRFPWISIWFSVRDPILQAPSTHPILHHLQSLRLLYPLQLL